MTKSSALEFYEKEDLTRQWANTSGILSYNYDHGSDIEIRQCKYLNNVVEQDHRFIKKLINPTLGFKSFYSARVTIAGIELMHMIRKGQITKRHAKNRTCAEQCYSLAA